MNQTPTNMGYSDVIGPVTGWNGSPSHWQAYAKKVTTVTLVTSPNFFESRNLLGDSPM